MSSRLKMLGLVKIPNHEKYIPALLSFTEKIALTMGFPPKAVNGLQLALDETCMDVIKYSFEKNEESEFDVSFFQRPDGIEIHVHDMGIPYDPSITPDYDPESALTELNLEGLGTWLTKQMVNEYQFNNLGLKGKEVVLIKYFDSDSIAKGEKIKTDAEVVPDNIEPEIVDEKIDYEIRQMKPEEALEVCRCIYDCYGYSYANENIYFPDRVVAMNETGTLISALAVTDKGEIGGHVALLFYDSLPAEIGIAVTKQKFRKLGFAKLITLFLEGEAIKKGLAGIQVKEVTAHPYTQKFCAKLGFKDCGLLLAHSPKTLSFKGIADKLKQRNSDVLGFKYFNPPPKKIIYAPKQHQSIIKKLYDNLQAEVSFAEANYNPYEIDTVMNTTINPVRSLAEIVVLKIGKDILQLINQNMKKVYIDEIQVVEIFLSLGDYQTPFIVNKLEEMGFIFTGIMPETIMGDAIVLQFFNGIFVDYDSIVLVSDLAREMLDYVRKHDKRANL